MPNRRPPRPYLVVGTGVRPCREPDSLSMFGLISAAPRKIIPKRILCRKCCHSLSVTLSAMITSKRLAPVAPRSQYQIPRPCPSPRCRVTRRSARSAGNWAGFIYRVRLDTGGLHRLYVAATSPIAHELPGSDANDSSEVYSRRSLLLPWSSFSPAFGSTVVVELELALDSPGRDGWLHRRILSRYGGIG